MPIYFIKTKATQIRNESKLKLKNEQEGVGKAEKGKAQRVELADKISTRAH